MPWFDLIIISAIWFINKWKSKEAKSAVLLYCSHVLSLRIRKYEKVKQIKKLNFQDNVHVTIFILAVTTTKHLYINFGKDWKTYCC